MKDKEFAKMTIGKIKKEMLEWKDFWGGEIINSDEIDKAKTKKELAQILDRHENFMKYQAIDAESHLENFRRKLNISTF